MDQRILIVGAGISGLTLASLLYQRGFRNVVLIEKAASYRTDGYILGLWGNGLRILRGLGLYQRVIELGSQIDQFVVMKHDATKITAFSLDRVTER
jgi:2-polyprenyl-6-methoxyphenol hydroxylase-like FAD-dependent oxidoreductase